MPTAAEREWEAATEKTDRPNLDSRGQHQGDFREYRGALAWIEWLDRSATILKLEAGAERGSARPLIEMLKRIADKHGLELQGNVCAYATEHHPADQARAVAFYLRRGFYVGGPPHYEIRYPPAI